MFQQQHFIYHILIILAIFQTFSLLLYLLWWSVINDLPCFSWKKIRTYWRLRWCLAFFSNKVVLKYVVFFLDIILLSRLQHNVNINLYVLGNQKVCITCFIAVFWNQTCNTSSVGLYFHCQWLENNFCGLFLKESYRMCLHWLHRIRLLKNTQSTSRCTYISLCWSKGCGTREESAGNHPGLLAPRFFLSDIECTLFSDYKLPSYVPSTLI